MLVVESEGAELCSYPTDPFSEKIILVKGTIIVREKPLIPAKRIINRIAPIRGFRCGFKNPNSLR
jgi:hypothetical protein